MQTGRLFEIIYFLLNKKSVTANELAEHFGVSRRTICRDIDKLDLAGVPIYTERGKGGGIRLLPDFVLNKFILNEQEQNEILSSLQILANVKADDTKQTLRKLSTIFNKTTTNWMEVDFSDWGNENNIWGDLKTAILEQRIITFDYYNSKGEKNFRRIESMQLVFKSKSWYLTGFCLTRQDIRVFKLSRIKNLVLIDECFDRRDLPAISYGITKDLEEHKEVKVKVRIAPEMTYRVHDDFHESAIEKQPDGSFIATATFLEDNWVYGFLLSYGKHIEVLEPKRIRTFLKKEVKNILKKYL